MLTITKTTVTPEQVWAAFRRTHDVRLRDEETIRTWVHALNEAGLPGLERAPIPGRQA
jgi:hypothetical protein